MSNEESTASSPQVDRRSFLATTAAGVGAGLLAAAPWAGAQDRRRGIDVRADAFAQTHEVKPLPFDSSKLDARFAADPEGVTKFFSDETNGFAARADAAIEQLVGVNHSVLLSRAEVLQRQVEDYAQRIDAMNARLDHSREALLKQFYNMELVIGRIKNNLDAIGSIQYIPPVQSGGS